MPIGKRPSRSVTQQRGRTSEYAGLVIAAHGRHYAVELPDAELLHCYPRGKKTTYACGDMVKIERSGDKQATITAVRPRTSLLYRSDRQRQKIIAANVTQAVIVIAARPAFNENLLMRCLIACEQQRIRALIVLNKVDLAEEAAKASAQLALYAGLGYPVVPLSARNDISRLRPALHDHRNVLVGQSGMGKSTIVNALVPAARARTAEISQALDSGKHTTSSAHLYHLDAGSSIIDSPGLQTFGLLHLTAAELVASFPEFRPFLGNCRFDDCRHLVEPGCAIISAVENNRIEQRRWDAYREIRAELQSKPPEWA